MNKNTESSNKKFDYQGKRISGYSASVHAVAFSIAAFLLIVVVLSIVKIFSL